MTCLIPTWMSQEVSKWLVNDLYIAIGYIVVITHLPFPNFLVHPSRAYGCWTPWTHCYCWGGSKEPQIRKIMATLVSICGGAEQAAYAIVWRPELLELESAASLRESSQARLKIGGILVG